MSVSPLLTLPLEIYGIFTEFIGDYHELESIAEVIPVNPDKCTSLTVRDEDDMDLLYYYNEQLIIINCNRMGIDFLPNLPMVEELNCANNELFSLPDLPRIRKLDCSGNYLEELPVSVSNCTVLICSMNRITMLPPTLYAFIFDCSINLLTILPEMPNVGLLYCNYNQLTRLPTLPECDTIYCYNNLLTTFPVLPKIRYIECVCNPIVSLPDLPGVIIIQ
jgi:Leucine-rich repeat (LRR) protein